MIEEGIPLSIPHGVLIQSGIDTIFVAKFALFFALILLGTVFLGKIFKKSFHIPVIAGQILAGIVLGPTGINIAHFSLFTQPLTIIDQATGKFFSLVSSDLFIFYLLLISSALTVSFLLWIAGHETDIKDVFKVGFTATVAGVLGALLPIALLFALLYYGIGGPFSLVTSLGIGIIFAATSVSIPVAMLVSQRKMHLRMAKATLGAAIIDDIVAVIILSLFTMLLNAGSLGTKIAQQTHSGSIISSLVSMLIAFALICAIGYFIVPRFLEWLRKKKIGHLIPPTAVGIMMIYFAFAELFGGLAGITGAYFAGLFNKMGDHRHTAQKALSPFINAILLPLFLGSIGLTVNLKVLTWHQWIIAGILLVTAVLSKMLSCYGATWLSNLLGETKQPWSMLESYLFGSAMVARGEVCLVVATILNGARIITPEDYVICVVVIILTTIISPIMLSVGFAQLEKQKRRDQGTDEFELNIGFFNVTGINQMFNIIINELEEHHEFGSALQIGEGHRIITLVGFNVRIVLDPSEGIIFKGDPVKIEQIIHIIKDAMANEIGAIPIPK